MTNFPNRRFLGQWGEETAAAYLTGHGYQIVQRNYRCLYGEMDLICKEKATWCFVEVKTRRRYSAYGKGYEGVTPVKQRRLIRIAEYFLSERALGEAAVRFDVVSIDYGSPRDYRLSLLKNAFTD